MSAALEHDHATTTSTLHSSGGGHRGSVPPITTGRFRDDDPAAATGEFDGDAERHHRRTEPTRDRRIERNSPSRQGTHVTRDDLDSIGPPEPANHSLEEVGSLRTTISQDHREIRSIVGHDQPGHPTTGTEVDHPTRHPVEFSDDSPGMVDDIVDRSRTEETEALRLREHVVQRRRHRRVRCPAGHPPSLADAMQIIVRSPTTTTARHPRGVGPSARMELEDVVRPERPRRGDSDRRLLTGCSRRLRR